MKREILFRGKRIDTGEWVEGYLTELWSPKKSERKFAIDCADKFSFDGESINVHPVHPDTVGQLWKPSLNIRFFGGDVFTAICTPSGGEVKERRKCKVIDTDSGYSIAVWYNNEWWAYRTMDLTSIEIIGTIHDDTEATP